MNARADFYAALAATDLPQPHRVQFLSTFVDLGLDTLDDVRIWAAALGAATGAPYLRPDGTHRQLGFYQHEGTFGGLAVSALAAEPVSTEEPPEDLTPGVEEVAAPAGEFGAATAPEELVWVARVRQGTPYHRPEPDDRTRCGRSTRAGTLIGVPEAVALAGNACPRCWPDGHDARDGAA